MNVAPVDPPAPKERIWRRKSDMIVGSSPSTQLLLASLDRLAPMSAPVLVTGESGTGKELVARALHYASPRASHPFLTVNCAAIPESLFESELFGYHRGAFTGAVASRSGVFDAAGAGTVFLDEIGEMPLGVQPKLLRVLERNEVTRLGSTEQRKISARVVCATNREIADEVKQGRFRRDLYYRISVFALHVAPLRERPEDIPALIIHHLSEVCERERLPTPKMTAAAIDRLMEFSWPGNVRELVNVVQRAVLVADRGVIDARHIDLPAGHEESVPLLLPYQRAKTEFERTYWVKVLRVSAGNVSHAARLARKTRREVYDVLKKLALDPAMYRLADGAPDARSKKRPG